MYTRLTKKVTVGDKEYVACAYYGTEKCRVHTGVVDCTHCEMFAAILNQLSFYEDIVLEEAQVATE